MKKWISTLACLGLVIAVGCQQETATNVETSTPAPAANVDGSRYILNDEPEGAKDVIAVRETAKDGDEILIVGRIGGDRNPWIDGRAAFTIVDNSLKACSDIPGDKCKTPWDYCCASGVNDSKALVKVVDENGEVVKAGAADLLDVKELSTVVIKGKAERDDDGNLVVLASGVHVKKK